jgi:hypothetical protein
VLARDGKLYAAVVSGNILSINPGGTAQELFAGLMKISQKDTSHEHDLLLSLFGKSGQKRRCAGDNGRWVCSIAWRSEPTTETVTKDSRRNSGG